jgi:hypothetical protein
MNRQPVPSAPPPRSCGCGQLNWQRCKVGRPVSRRHWRKMKISRALLSAALAVACVIAWAKQPLTEVTTGSSQGVVLPVSIAPGVLNQCSRSTPGTPDGYWEPKQQDVQSLEELLPAYLRTRKEQQATRVLDRLSQYRRQYAGFLRGGGIEFDTTSNTFVHIAYNGVA